MFKSTKEEIEKNEKLVADTSAAINALIKSGKKVHIIWDFDGVLADSRSDDVFKLFNFDLKKYFDYEERLLFQSPGPGQWILPIAHNTGRGIHFPPEQFSQDIVTARSSFMAMRVQIFCLSWHMPTRWMLFLGHQPKEGSYRIILESLKQDQDSHIFCVDDSPKHIDTFNRVSTELNMESRSTGIFSPAIRTYTKTELKKHIASVLSAKGNKPLRVRDPSDDMRGFIVLPNGVVQFREQINCVVNEQSSEGHTTELRNAFVQAYGEVGVGRFKTEQELDDAMYQFIIDKHT
ncbi:MAG: hypothetical protein Q7S12_02745 [bacterium]|nr:hypothetical protein [bacterium]